MTASSSSSTGLAFELSLDGHGGRSEPPAPGQATWQHFCVEGREARVLVERAGLQPRTAAELARPKPRPRASILAGGLLVVLRGVNLNPGADPEDMVSVRLWLTPERIVSVSPRRVMAVEDVVERLRTGRGPTSSSELLVLLAECLLERMRPTLDELEERADELEDRLIADPTTALTNDIGDLRRVVILLRRHLAPQRDALTRLHREPIDWLDPRVADHLREIAERTARVVEHLDSIRDLGTVLHDQLDARTSAKLNRNLYMMTVVASVFLPLSFVTGLLGINVGGMPGVETPLAFWAVVVLLVALTAVELWILRRLGIIGSKHH